jgi:hypothetical protein
MKVDISIEATAQEMREFLGLPNIRPLQEEILQVISDNMRKGVTGFDALSLMKPMLPAQFHSMEMLQKAFWDAFSKASSNNTKESERESSSGKTEKK